MANVERKARVVSVDGMKVVSHVRDFEFIMDEPEKLGGTNQGMNPIEAMLSAVGGCKIIVARSFSKLHNIHLKDITVEVSGILDTDGFLGKNPEAKVGLSELKSIYHIKADNTKEEIEAFVDFIEKTCPVIDTISHAPKLKEEIHLN
ncbi:OsmC family protein [Atopobacter phocae]|uniref:OsmC family protein n=1 Tax=Atopobacter phocae TaxID=136492 RepID=UPI0004706645|nr:OsmC family protein [Atopobacter phocae]